MAYVVMASIGAAFFCSIIMTYVALATPFGPWMEPILVVIGLPLISLLKFSSCHHRNEFLACNAAAGGIAGIGAVGVSFSYPTLFFLEPATFNEIVQSPYSFIAVLALFIFAAGSIAFTLVALWEKALLQRSDLAFPVAQLVFKSLEDTEQHAAGSLFVKGSTVTILFYGISGLIRYVLEWFSVSLPVLLTQLGGVAALAPLLVSLGVITSFSIAVPLLIGLGAKTLIIEPLHTVFSYIPREQFFFGWCGGILVASTCKSFWDLAWRWYTQFKPRFWQHASMPSVQLSGFSKELLVSIAGSFLGTFYLLKYFHFSWIASLYLLAATTVCTYQLVEIGGAIGLAPLGRFALFVTLPGLFLFNYTAIQVTLVALFVELCGGMAVDILFGRKLSQLLSIAPRRMLQSQIIGLLVGGITTGVVLWALSTYGSLGVAPLLAQRSYTRALLLRAPSLHIVPIVLGVLFAGFCHVLRINTVIVMSGLLMPAQTVLPLALGNILSRYKVGSATYYPFWSALFALGSLVLCVRAIFSL